MITYRAQLPGGPPMLAQRSFVQMFYDTRVRIWTIQILDGHYNQIGDADYAIGCHGFKEAAKHAELFPGAKLKFERL